MNNIDVLQTEIEKGAQAYQRGYHGGLRSLPNRISHNLAARIPLQPIKMKLTRPMLTLTFDDASKSAVDVGTEVLHYFNVRATYYIATDLMGRHISGSLKTDSKDIVNLHQAGHEIGLHSHIHMPIFSHSKAELEADIVENKAILQEILPNFAAKNFCYPYGASSFQHKYWLKSKVRSARSVWKDVNQHTLDPYFLKAQMIDSDYLQPHSIENMLNNALKNNGWAITISHQVGHNNNLSTKPETLNLLIKMAIDKGFEIVTINQGLDKIQMNKDNSHVKL